MKRYILILITFIIAQLIMVCCIINHKDVFFDINRDGTVVVNKKITDINKFTFKSLEYVASDSEDNLYTFDDSANRIIKFDKNREIKYIIQKKKLPGNTYEQFNDDIAIGNDRSIYVLNEVYSASKNCVLEEQILKYNSRGKFQKVIYSQKYSDKDSVETGFLRNLKVSNNSLYFYDIRDNNIILKNVDLNGGNLSIVQSINVPKDYYVMNVVGLEKGKIFCNTKRGEIYRINEDGTFTQLYRDIDNNDGTKMLPEFIKCDNDYVYFVDAIGKKIKVFQMQDPYEAVSVISLNDILNEKIKTPYLDCLNVENNSLYLATNNNVLCIKNGKVVFSTDYVNYSIYDSFLRLVVYVMPLIELILFIITIRFLYCKILKKRVSLLLKQILAFLPIILAFAIIFVYIYKGMYEYYNNTYQYNLKILAHMGATKIDPTLVEKINKPSDFMNEDYIKLKNQLHSLFRGKPKIEDVPFSGYVYKFEDNYVYSCANYDDSQAPCTPDDSTNYKYHEMVKAAVSDGKVRSDEAYNSTGQYMYAVAPMYNAKGKVVGFFEIDSPMNEFEAYEKDSVNRILKISLPIIFIMIVIFFIITYNSLRSIQEVRRAAGEIASGKWDTEVNVKSKDEVEELGYGFNAMSKHIKNYILQITELSESYYRFVPQQYLSMLGKESILDVHLGDEVKCNMSILVLNIRDFSALSETMSPEENFAFINSFLKDISPLIEKNNGFIDKFKGSGIIVLFPDDGVNPVNTSLQITKKLRHFNKNIKNKIKGEVDVGIGIHKGSLMLGIVGDKKRLEGSVISDNMNLTNTLEEISQKLGAVILVTEEIIKDIENKNYKHRFLGFVGFEGKEKPIRIYDLYEGDKEEIRETKDKTKKLFEEGVKLYQDKDFYNARSNFLKVVKRDDEDKAAKIYFFLCDKYCKEEVGQDWKGILVIK